MKATGFEAIREANSEFGGIRAEDKYVEWIENGDVIHYAKAKIVLFYKFDKSEIHIENLSDEYENDDLISQTINKYSLKFWDIEFSRRKDSYGEHCQIKIINKNDKESIIIIKV